MTVLYCGDTELAGAAGYLAGLMTHWDWRFDYVSSATPLHREQVTRASLFIFSDYPASQVEAALQHDIVNRVRDGAGLLMIGGWESFHGLGGDWDRSAIAELLPVDIAANDDRVNFSQPTLLQRIAEHPAIAALLWETEPPGIGGMNRVQAKSDAHVALVAQPFRVAHTADNYYFEPQATLPALVLGEAGQGRTAAFLSDVAPHWVGGFVDWGDARVTAQASGASAIEVGNWYAQFWRQLLQWTARIS